MSNLQASQLNSIVEPENPSLLVQNMVGFPASVARYKNRDTTSFQYENPTITDSSALEPTSGRKLWKLRHNKQIRKPLKKDKNGYVGGS